MKVFFKILLTAAISLNLLGAFMPPKSCGMPCCQARPASDMAMAACAADTSAGHYLRAPKMPCCMARAARRLVPAMVNTAQAERSLSGAHVTSGPSFAANIFPGKSPLITGSPPWASARIPVYKLISVYLC